MIVHFLFPVVGARNGNSYGGVVVEVGLGPTFFHYIVGLLYPAIESDGPSYMNCRMHYLKVDCWGSLLCIYLCMTCLANDYEVGRIKKMLLVIIVVLSHKREKFNRGRNTYVPVCV
ncbi:hypothetical protein BGZ60DRAFT_411623 [Tricladium varicosporioides]|nr:hypothetical protein BGZ60DRAFT_411623 [Hymenoscyphus varicosporioides]